MMAAIIATIAITVEITREQKDSSNIEGNPLLGFLVQQGVTAGVNMVAMEESSHFTPHAFNYLWRQIFSPFYSQPEVPSGWFLANDISLLIQPQAFALGFGTGSSYFAELFLLGGPLAILGGSMLIGMLLRHLKRNSDGVIGALSFWITCGLIYYPRTMLQDPIHNLIRYGPAILLISTFCWTIKQIHQFFLNEV